MGVFLLFTINISEIVSLSWLLPIPTVKNFNYFTANFQQKLYSFGFSRMDQKIGKKVTNSIIWENVSVI